MPQLQFVPDEYANETAQALGNIVGGFAGPSPKVQAEAMTLAAQMRKANMEQQALAQRMRQEQTEFGWKTQDRQRADELRGQDQRNIDAIAKGARLSAGQHPPMVLQNSPEMYDDWQTRANAAEAGARYSAQGGGTFNQRASGVKTLDEVYPARAPAPITTLPGMTPEIAANPEAAKKYAEQYAHDAAKNAAGGPAQIAAANETLVKLDNAERAYKGLAAQGEVGPWAGGVIGQTWDKYGWGNSDAAGLRESYTAAANQLQLELAKLNFAGQGAVTENERRILAQTLPQLNSANAEQAIGLLQQMRETAQRVIQRQQGLSANYGSRGQSSYGGGGGQPAPQRRQPSQQDIQTLREGLQSGDPTVAQEFAEEFGHDVLQAIIGGGH